MNDEDFFIYILHTLSQVIRERNGKKRCFVCWLRKSFLYTPILLWVMGHGYMGCFTFDTVPLLLNFNSSPWSWLLCLSFCFVGSKDTHFYYLWLLKHLYLPNFSFPFPLFLLLYYANDFPLTGLCPYCSPQWPINV